MVLFINKTLYDDLYKIYINNFDNEDDFNKEITNFYSLDAIIAVGYRVNSKEATDFRIWATKTLKELLLKRNYQIIKINTYF